MKEFLSLAVTLMLLVSCTTEIDQQFGSRAAIPGGKPVFKASVEECSVPETKVYADENMKVLWNADDRISIFNMTTSNAEYAFEGEDGDTAGGFEWVSEGDGGEDIDCVYAVYPYQPGTTVSTSGVVTMTLPAEQSYKVHSFGVGANTMVAVTDGTFLAFKNVGGYLSLRLYGDNISVRRITIKGNNGEKIAGKATIMMPMGGTPTVTMDDSGTDAVSIVCDPAVKLGKSETSYTDFWFVIPPVMFTGGFEITVVDDMGGTFTRKTTKSFEVKRNTLDWMAALKVEPDYDNVGIEFEDENFEAFCLSNYDSNHDGVVTGAEVENIKVVNVCTDNITSIKGIEFFASLEQLTCKGSKIGTKGPGESYAGQLERIDVSKNVHLWELDCSGNKLEEVDVSNNPNLQTLICTDNPIEDVILAPDQVVATLESPVESNVVYEWDDDVENTQGADEIWYTTKDGSPVTLNNNASFGDVTVVSNTYADGKGILKFSGPVKTIGRATFELSSLSSITLPEGFTTLGDWAFSHCYDMVSVTMPSTLTHIGKYAFTSSYQLTYLTIPDNVTEIGVAAFLALTSVKSYQGKYASSDHKCLVKDGSLITVAPAGLTSLIIPDGVTGIADYALATCSTIQSVTIPSSVTSIGERAFESCSISSIALPNGLTYIGTQAFYGCKNLTSITIPQNVTSISDMAFFMCSGLAEFNGKFASDDHRCLVIGGDIIAFAPAGLSEYVVPSNVTGIGYGAFSYCSSLTAITVPDNVVCINESAFNGCFSLSFIKVLSTTPPTMQVWNNPNNVFLNTNNCPIYVPSAAVDAYKGAEGWSQYAGRITAMPSDVVPADFPDESFRAYVFSNFDTDKDGVLSTAECNAVTRIEVGADSIATVQGIESFQNLVHFSCQGSNSYNNGTFEFLGRLTSLDVSKNTALQFIDCDNNQITALDVTNNTALKSLYCHGNKLTSLDVSNNTALEQLSCGYNQLASLELNNNTSLSYLSCNMNQLTALDVSNNTALETLGFNNNQVSGIDLSHNSALLSLDCAKNQLTSLDVSANTALTWLQCDGNSFSQLDVSHNTALQSLVCRNTPLTTLDVSNNLALNTLWCSSSTLSTLYMAPGQEITELSKNEYTQIVYVGVPVAVDMGLTVKWATFNLGAMKPENMGDHYAWGETTPYYSSLNPLSWKQDKENGYAWASYTFNPTGDAATFTKYTGSDYSTLQSTDDAAAVNWGGSWRMPTVDEWLELRNTSNCDWTWVDNYNNSGVCGYLVTSKKSGYEGNSIFLPAAGDWTGTNHLNLTPGEEWGNYWSSSLNTDSPRYAYQPYFRSCLVQWSSSNRYYGCSIRPVTQ